MNFFHFLFQEYAQSFANKRESALRKMPPISWQKGEKGDIILLQGWTENWVFFKTIGNYLNNLGYRIHSIPELENNRLTIAKASAVLERYITEHNLKGCILLSHSKGGLIGKYFLSMSSYADRVRLLIAIVTPFNGTLLGFISKHHALEFTPYAKMVLFLKKQNKVNEKIVNIYGSFDNHVLPNKNLFLSGAKNIQLPVMGHTLILEAKETREILRTTLETA